MGEIQKEAQKNGLEVHTKVEYNFNYNDIVKTAEEWGMDLIVMGSHGASGWNEMFIGSITQKLVRVSNIPVLVVKGDTDLSSFKNMVFASDFEEEKAKKTFQKAVTFAKIFGAKVHLLYVNTPNHFDDTEFTYKKMSDFVDSVGNDVETEYHIFNEYTVEDGIMGFAEMKEMDLIATATHGFKGLRRMVHVNITENLINHSPKPILCLNMKE